MSDAPPPALPDVDLVAMLNAHRGGFDGSIGLTYTTATPDLVVAEVPVTPALLQPYGLVHGGVYCAIAETVASAGAAIDAMARGWSTVGLENSTAFVHAIRAGKIIATATPMQKGRRTQIWQVALRDEAGKLAATSRVRTLCLEPGAAIAGETVKVKP